MRCEHAAAGTENLMPYLFDAVKGYATVGEICDALRVGVRRVRGDCGYLRSTSN